MKDENYSSKEIISNKVKLPGTFDEKNAFKSLKTQFENFSLFNFLKLLELTWFLILLKIHN
jgi:hypothetical protein